MRRVPAILIVIFLACPLLFASFVAISLGTWTLDRRLYLSLLDDKRLFQLPDAVSSASWSTTAIDGIGGLPWKSVGRAAAEILTPEYLQSQASRVLNQAFDTFDGRSRRFAFTVDTAPVKAALRSDAGRRFARMLAEDLPAGGGIADFKVVPGRLPVARPAALSVDQAASIIQSGLPVFVSNTPDALRLGDDPQFNMNSGSWGERPEIRLYRVMLAVCIVLLVIAVGLWIAAAFIGGETRFERLQWLGWSLLAPAAGVLLMGLAVELSSASPWAHWGIENARLQLQGFHASFVSALIDAARHVVARAGIGFLTTGGIGAGLSLGLLAWSWSIPHDERKGVTT
jgi:hypothetical protein